MSGALSELAEQGRAWLVDCGCPDEVLVSRTDAAVLQEVNRQHEGGLVAFITDGGY